jgi:hypothetical protein
MSEAIFCYDTATVRFAIYPHGKQGARCIAQISEDPLRDLFGAKGGGETLVRAYQANAALIDAQALARYRAAPGQPVLLTTADFELTEHGAPAYA